MVLNFDSEFYCTSCGGKQIFVIPRDRARERGHLKHMWCFNCQKDVNFVECKKFSKYSYSDFLLEFTYGNFNEAGARILPYGKFRDKIHHEGVDLHEFEEEE